MSDELRFKIDPALVGFDFRLDEGLKELNLGPKAKGEGDAFTMTAPDIYAWMLGGLKGLANGIFYLGVIAPYGGQGLIGGVRPTDSDGRGDECRPTYSGAISDGGRGLEAGVFVFGPVFHDVYGIAPEGWEVALNNWEANAAGVLRCLPGVSAEF